MQKTFDDTIIYYHILLDPVHNYEKLNNLKTINDNYGKGPIKVNKELIEIIKEAIEISKLTNGYFNPTIGVCSNTWKSLFNEKHINKDPDILTIQNDLNSMLSINEYDKYIIIDENNNTIDFKKKENINSIIIDLGAIAKGYVLDKAYEALLQYNTSFLISAGGSSIITYVDKNDISTDWTIGIKNPNTNASSMELTVKNSCFSTSGDNEQFFINEQGVRRHHILNPYTGFPMNNYRSITLFSKSKAYVLDALSTALFSANNNEIEPIMLKFENKYNIDIKKVIIDDDLNNSNNLTLQYDEINDLIKYNIDKTQFSSINTK